MQASSQSKIWSFNIWLSWVFLVCLLSWIMNRLIQQSLVHLRFLPLRIKLTHTLVRDIWMKNLHLPRKRSLRSFLHFRILGLILNQWRIFNESVIRDVSSKLSDILHQFRLMRQLVSSFNTLLQVFSIWSRWGILAWVVENSLSRINVYLSALRGCWAIAFSHSRFRLLRVWPIFRFWTSQRLEKSFCGFIPSHVEETAIQI